MSFRETREMLLLAYNGKIISDVDLFVLWEGCRSKNPDFPHSSYARFGLENIDETEYLAEFRVQKQDIPVLANFFNYHSTAFPHKEQSVIELKFINCSVKLKKL